MLPVTADMQRLIVERAPEPDLAEAAREHGGISMQEDAIKKRLVGHTSFIEVMSLGRI